MNHSTLQEIPSKPGSAEELRKSLNALSQRAIQTNVKDQDQVMGPGLEFQDLDRVRPAYGYRVVQKPLSASRGNNSSVEKRGSLVPVDGKTPETYPFEPSFVGKSR